MSCSSLGFFILFFLYVSCEIEQVWIVKHNGTTCSHRIVQLYSGFNTIDRLLLPPRFSLLVVAPSAESVQLTREGRAAVAAPEPPFLFPPRTGEPGDCPAETWTLAEFERFVFVPSVGASFSFQYDWSSSFSSRSFVSGKGDCKTVAHLPCGRNTQRSFVCSKDLSGNANNANAVVFEANGNSFTQRQYAGLARGVAVGDINGDGKADLVARTSMELAVVLLSNGNDDGTCSDSRFNAASIAGTNSESMLLLDVDGDSDLDLVNWAHGGAWYENRGYPTSAFVSHAKLPFAGDLQPADVAFSEAAYSFDVNNDGLRDFLYMDENGWQYFECSREPSALGGLRYTNKVLAPGLPVSTRVIFEQNDVLFADCNLDGHQDVLLALGGESGLYMFDGTTYTRNAELRFDGARRADFCDIDGDGDQDIVVTDTNFNARIFLNENGDCGDFREYEDVSGFGELVFCLDVDNDGDMDLWVGDDVRRNEIGNDEEHVWGRVALQVSLTGVGNMKSASGAVVRVFEASNTAQMVGRADIGDTGRVFGADFAPRFYLRRGIPHTVRVTYPSGSEQSMVGFFTSETDRVQFLPLQQEDTLEDTAIFLYPPPSSTLVIEQIDLTTGVPQSLQSMQLVSAQWPAEALQTTNMLRVTVESKSPSIVMLRDTASDAAPQQQAQWFADVPIDQSDADFFDNLTLLPLSAGTATLEITVVDLWAAKEAASSSARATTHQLRVSVESEVEFTFNGGREPSTDVPGQPSATDNENGGTATTTSFVGGGEPSSNIVTIAAAAGGGACCCLIIALLLCFVVRKRRSRKPPTASNTVIGNYVEMQSPRDSPSTTTTTPTPKTTTPTPRAGNGALYTSFDAHNAAQQPEIVYDASVPSNPTDIVYTSL